MDKNRRRTGRLGRRTPGVRWGLCLASLAEQETAPHPHGTTASMMAKTIVEHQKLCGGEFSCWQVQAARNGERMQNMRRRRFLATTLLLPILLFGTNGISADDVLTASDRQYLSSIGYEEQSNALERSSTKGQRKYLHKLINRPKISAKKKMNLVSSYLTAIGIGTVPK